MLGLYIQQPKGCLPHPLRSSFAKGYGRTSTYFAKATKVKESYAGQEELRQPDGCLRVKLQQPKGGVPEWSNGPHSKCGVLVRVP